MLRQVNRRFEINLIIPVIYKYDILAEWNVKIVHSIIINTVSGIHNLTGFGIYGTGSADVIIASETYMPAAYGNA